MIGIGLDQHIEITPDIRAGKPRIAGTRMTIADIVLMHIHADQTLESIAETYDLPLAGIYAALAYYYDHQAEIDRSIADEKAFYEQAKQNHRSPLQDKLKAQEVA